MGWRDDPVTPGGATWQGDPIATDEQALQSAKRAKAEVLRYSQGLMNQGNPAKRAEFLQTVPEYLRPIVVGETVSTAGQTAGMEELNVGSRSLVAASRAVQGYTESVKDFSRPDSERQLRREMEAGIAGATPHVLADDPWYKSGVVQAGEMFPLMGAMAATGGMAGGLASGAGAGAVGVGAATTAGITAVGFPQFYQDALTEMEQAGVRTEWAKPAAALSAVLEGAIESILPDPFGGPGKAVSRNMKAAMRRAAVDFLRRFGMEVTEEALQGASRAAITAAMTQLDPNAPDREIVQGALDAAWEEGKASIVPMLFLMGPGGAVQTAKAGMGAKAKGMDKAAAAETAAALDTPVAADLYWQTRPDEATSLIAEEGTPSRAQWAKAGLPPIGGPQRAAFVERLRERQPQQAQQPQQQSSDLPVADQIADQIAEPIADPFAEEPTGQPALSRALPIAEAIEDPFELGGLERALDEGEADVPVLPEVPPDAPIADPFAATSQPAAVEESLPVEQTGVKESLTTETADATTPATATTGEEFKRLAVPGATFRHSSYPQTIFEVTPEGGILARDGGIVRTMGTVESMSNYKSGTWTFDAPTQTEAPAAPVAQGALAAVEPVAEPPAAAEATTPTAEPPDPAPPVVEPEGVWQGRDARGWMRSELKEEAKKLGINPGVRSNRAIIDEAREVEAAIEDHAKDRGIKPPLLRQAIDEVLPAERERVETQREAVKQAQGLIHLYPSQISRLENNGKDRSNVKGFDDAQQEIEAAYPGLLRDPLDESRDPGDVLWNLLKKRQGDFQHPRADDPVVLKAAETVLELSGAEYQAVTEKREVAPEELADVNAALAEAPSLDELSDSDLDAYERERAQREQARESSGQPKPARATRPLRSKPEVAKTLDTEIADLKTELGSALSDLKGIIGRQLGKLGADEVGSVRFALNDDIKAVLRRAVVAAAKLSVKLGQRNVLTFGEFVSRLPAELRDAGDEVDGYLRSVWETVRTRTSGHRLAPIDRPEATPELTQKPASKPIRKPDSELPRAVPILDKAKSTGSTPPPGGAATSTAIAEPYRQEAVGLSNALVAEYRAKRGDPDLRAAGVTEKPFEDTMRESSGAYSPGVVAGLMAELRNKPRPLADWEHGVLLIQERKLANEADAAHKRFQAETAAGNTIGAAVAETDLKFAVAQLNDLESLLYVPEQAGTAIGRAFNARKMALKDDYSLAGLIRNEVKLKGRGLTDAEIATLQGIADRIEGFQERLEQLEIQRAIDAEIAKSTPAKATKQSPAERKQAASTRKQAAWEKLKTSWDAMKQVGAVYDPKAEAAKQAALLRDAAELAQAYIEEKVATWLEFWAKVKSDFGAQAEPIKGTFKAAWDSLAAVRPDVKVDPTSEESIGRLARKLTRAVVEAGETNRDKVVDAVHEQLTEILGKDWTPRNTQDAISGYGRFRELSKDQVSKEVRRISGELQQLAKLEDMAAGKAPLKTGIERREVGFDESVLIKEVNEAKKRGGYEVTDPEKQLKTALDAAKTAARNRLRELDLEISRRQRIVKEKKTLVPDAELTELRRLIAERVAVHELVFPRAPLTDAQRAERGAKALGRIADQLEKDMASGKLWPDARKPAPSSPAYEAAKARVEALRAQRDELRDQKDPNRAYRASLHKRLADLKERVANEDFAPKPLRKERRLSKAEVAVLHQIEREKQELKAGQDRWKREHRTLPEKIGGTTVDVLDASRKLITSFDVSAVGRQGAFAVAGHPQLAAEAAREMFRAMSERGTVEVIKNLQLRENYQNGLYDRAKLPITDPTAGVSQQEEAWIGHVFQRVPDRLQTTGARAATLGIPEVAIRATIISERAYVAFLNQMRVEVFDSLVASYQSRWGEISTAEAQVLAKFVGAATGRGTTLGFESSATALARVFFAPRFVMSRFQLLLAPFGGFYFGKGSTMRTRKLIAQEYGRSLGGAAVFYGLVALAAAALWDDDDKDKPTVEWDWRSSDFGKIRMGNTRLDPLGGLSQVTVLIGRIRTGETKQTTTGKVVALRGKDRPFGGATTMGVAGRFLRSKLSPALGMATNWLEGENVVGEEVTAYELAKDAAIPLSLRDIYAVMQDQGVPKGTALGLVSLFGLSLQTYESKRKKPKQNRRSVRRRAR